MKVPIPKSFDSSHPWDVREGSSAFTEACSRQVGPRRPDHSYNSLPHHREGAIHQDDYSSSSSSSIVSPRAISTTKDASRAGGRVRKRRREEEIDV